MKLKQAIRTSVQLILLLIYLYLLVKLILFKLGPVSLSSLLSQLQSTLHNPERILLRNGNYTPFKEISRGMNEMALSNPYSYSNLWGNIIAFIPLGIFIPVMLKLRRTGFIGVFILSFGLSLSFEVTQLLLYMGTFDVDDLILNTSGGLVGYIGYVIFKFLIGSIKKERPLPMQTI